MGIASSKKLSGQEIISKINGNYRSGKSDLGRDFFSPCLKYCNRYRRAVGYFSSGALIVWSGALEEILTDDVKIQLIISPNLSIEDKEALQRSLDEAERRKLRQTIADKVITDALSSPEKLNTADVRLELLAWLVANERLIIRFAFPEHMEDAGIFHEKIGIFDFPWGDTVAFTGSANESSMGHSRNYESIDVYRNWLSADIERVKTKVDEFEEAWNSQAQGLKIIPLSEEAIKLIKINAPNKKPSISPKNQTITPSNPTNDVLEPKVYEEKWRHQDEAVDKFLQVGHGVLEMATGTGKTRTTTKILSNLDDEEKLDAIIISTEGTDLLDQWAREIEPWSIGRRKPFRVLKHYASHHQLESFVNNNKGAVLIVSREKLAFLFKRLAPEKRKRMIIVHDEVHGLGSPVLRQSLAGQHQTFGYRLGLSATPEREYDIDGTEFIFQELGNVVFKFGLKDAIEQGILCEFNYIPLYYQLTDNDKQRLKQVYNKQSARAQVGNPMSQTELWIELARVYKTAEQKPDIFASFLRENSQYTRSTIIFVDNREYGYKILETIHGYTYKYRTYYAEDDRANLNKFANGNIDCLITCHRISQGIDIKNLKNVILFSSSRARLETIQRIGRCLRVNPNFPEKRATVIDFILQSEPDEDKDIISADEERYLWLSELSNTRRK
ncbi:DNA-repair protein [Dulcicalothrix desertica PCC 7102]|uniref:DNA-repair protein n=1 Tax=Dulcicalothrix desertica PCC 7102 TaxID=232991 RepID=A0A433VND6_9CYAN|nr:DEAD/DEAH box helicase family protein [Dulcicalothrix desertica]RUT07624.1 DNA-repair protein [Dulcicalothrix desertica PCC 7102]TWH39793.1 superfamily II DNA or RNA helicase [Dulcicalothrix desertica PCC 7102]